MFNKMLQRGKSNDFKNIYVQHIIFIVYEATCFGPYFAIIGPSYESRRQMMRTC